MIRYRLIFFFIFVSIHIKCGSAILCSPTPLNLYVQPGAGGSGLSLLSPADDLLTLYLSNFQGDQPIIVTFLGSPNPLPSSDYHPSFPFTAKCGVSFIGVNSSIVIQSNYGLLIEDGFGPVVIENLIFTNCVSSLNNGAALRPANIVTPNIGDVTLYNVTFSGCSSSLLGGSVYLYSLTAYALNISSTQFINSVGRLQGGALWVGGTSVSASLTDVEFSNCSVLGVGAAGGGAYFSFPGALTLTGLQVHDCTAPASGAGLYIVDTLINQIIIKSSNFYCNSATYGYAAIDFSTSINAQLQLCKFYNNTVTSSLCNGGDGCDLGPLIYASTQVNFTTCSDCCLNSIPSTSTSTSTLTSTSTSTTTSTPSSSTSASTFISSTSASTFISSTSASTFIPSTSASTFIPSTSASTFFPTIAPSTSALIPTTTSTAASISTVVGCSNVDCQACSGSNCPTLYFSGSSISNDSDSFIIVRSTNLDLVSVINGSILPYTVNWGSIREIQHSTRKVVKGIDLHRLDLYRFVMANSSHVIVIFSGTASYDTWRSHPIQIVLTAIYYRSPAASASSENFLKLSISLMGLWLFNSTKNTLHVDFSIHGAHQSDQCDKSYRQLSNNHTTIEFEVYGPNQTTTRYSFLKYCFVDDNPQEKPILINSPTFHNGTINFELIFPSFIEQLDYDPSFAILLGSYGSAGPCQDSLFQWILPASFIAGAALIVLLVIFLAHTPCLAPFAFGSEGHRVYKLRKVTSSQDPETNASYPVSDHDQSGW